MKTIFLSAFIALSLVATASGTKEKSAATYKLQQNFAAEFGDVENVTWSNALNNMTKATFTTDNQPTVAYFNQDGEFVAATRDAGFDELPKKLKEALLRKFAPQETGSIFEMTNAEGKCWFIETLHNNKKRLWKGNSSGKLDPYHLKF